MKKECIELLESGLNVLSANNTELLDSFVRYADHILMFNPVYKLVSANEEELVTRHILDSLAPVGIIERELLFTLKNDEKARKASDSKEKSEEERKKIIFGDLGSGAGLPGIPLGLYFSLKKDLNSLVASDFKVERLCKNEKDSDENISCTEKHHFVSFSENNVEKTGLCEKTVFAEKCKEGLINCENAVFPEKFAEGSVEGSVFSEYSGSVGKACFSEKSFSAEKINEGSSVADNSVFSGNRTEEFFSLKKSDGSDFLSETIQSEILQNTVLLSDKLHFSLVERMGRRSGFLRNVLTVLNMFDKMSVLEKNLSEVEEKFDFIVFRAFRRLKDIGNELARITKPGSVVFIYKGTIKDAADDFENATENFSDYFECVIASYSVPFLSEERCLLCLKRKKIDYGFLETK